MAAGGRGHGGGAARVRAAVRAGGGRARGAHGARRAAARAGAAGRGLHARRRAHRQPRLCANGRTSQTNTGNECSRVGRV